MYNDPGFNHGSKLQDGEDSTVTSHSLLQKQDWTDGRQANCQCYHQKRWDEQGYRQEHTGTVKDPL
jgi:hypothetical protein